MLEDVYLQPDAPDPVLSDELVLELVHRHVPTARAVMGVDESGGEARTYAIDEDLILKVQRPQQLRPRTSLEKEAYFLEQLARYSDISVPRVLGHGREGPLIEYTVMTRMPGVAVRNASLQRPARHEALIRLGTTLRRIHEIPQQPLEMSGLFPGDGDFADVRARFTEHFALVMRSIDDGGRAWPLSMPAEEVRQRALEALPETEQRVALHSNPAPEHTFVLPDTGEFSGLIDFGDAYASHPVFDLRRWPRPSDRDAVLEGYTMSQPVDEAFLATWRVAMVLADMVAIVHYPDAADEAARSLERTLEEL